MEDMVIMCENKEIAKDKLTNITKFLHKNKYNMKNIESID